MGNSPVSHRGQGATEYLVVLGAVLLVSMVVVQAVGSSASAGSSVRDEQSSTYWSSATPISITMAKLTADSLSLELANRLNEKVRITSISAVDNAGVSRALYNGSLILGSSEKNNVNNVDVRFNDGNPCKGKSSGAPFEIVQLVLNYDLANGISGNVQSGAKSLVGKCGATNDWISFVPPTPASGASAGQNFSINATVIGVQNLSEFYLNFNGTNYSIYNDSLVLAYNFEDNPAIGETAGKAVDVSGAGNNGEIYDNTVGLWRFDEGDGKTAYDETRFGNNGAIYGPTVGLWHFDATSGQFANDSTAYGNNGVCVGMGASCSSSVGKSGSGLQFDGVDDYVALGRATTLMLDKISVESWFKTSQSGTIYRFSSYAESLYISAGTPCFYIFNSSAYPFTACGTTQVVDNNWHHAVGTYNGTTVSIFVDGVLQNSTAAGTIYYDNLGTDRAAIGRNGEFSNAYFNGSIDEVAIYNRSLTAAEVLAHYNSGRAKFVEWNSSGKSGSALNFDGKSRNYLVVPGSNSAASPLAITGALTMAVWVKFNGSGTEAQIMGRGAAGWNGNYGYRIWRDGSNNRIIFDLHNATTTTPAISATTLADTNWHFIVATWDGTMNANGMKIFLDGALDRQAAAIIPSIGQPNYNFTIGDSSRGDQPFNGSIDEAAVYNRSVSAAEVASLYAAGKARRESFNPNGKWGAAMQFDGVDDYLLSSNSSSLNFDKNNFSVSFWANPTTTNLNIIRKQASSGSWGDGWFVSYASSSNSSLRFVTRPNDADTSGHWIYSSNISVGSWSHVAAVRVGSVLQFYINGVKDVESDVGVIDNVSSIAPVVIGIVSSYFNGSIDEVRVWNRALSSSEIRQQYYSNLQKYDANKWLFASNQTLLPSGTNAYYLYARSIDGAIEYSDNRTEVS